MFSLKSIFSKKSIILCYHRIASPLTDAWQLSVSSENFEQHLKILKQTKIVVPLPEIVDDVNKNSVSKKIGVCFDDGYTDNYVTALPLLKKYHVPATFFITSKNINTTNEFWWDELEYIIMQFPNLPAELTFEWKGNILNYHLKNECVLNEDVLLKNRNYKASLAPVSLRSELYFMLWKFLSPLQADELEQIMQIIRNWAGVAPCCRIDYTSMSQEKLFNLSKNSLFTIGGHTSTHPALSNFSKQEQQQEIDDNKKFLEQITNQKIDLFAYPSGNYNAATINTLKELEFKAAFTTSENVIRNDDDPFEISRYMVKNDAKDLFAKRIKHWLHT